MPNVRREDFDKIVKIFNESGSKSTMEYIKQNYGIKYPRGVLSRIKKSPAYSYDSVSNKFLCKNEPFDKSIFLGIDELCMPTDSVGLAAASSVPAEAMVDFALDSLYQELMRDKLIELTKYVRLSRYTNTISINKTALMADGYKVAIH